MDNNEFEVLRAKLKVLIAVTDKKEVASNYDIVNAMRKEEIDLHYRKLELFSKASMRLSSLLCDF
jgi:hypothetical protein